jgi:Kef-type K+ transport system membrane component KefB
MQKVLLYSILLVAGLVVSQFLNGVGAYSIKLLTMLMLSFIMIHVGYEFEIDKRRPRQYVWDYVVAATAAAFPWLFCALYFVFVMAPPGLWSHPDLWKETFLEGRFASPTSAGVLFSMLAAAGLAATWVYKKARILAIFDDLDTILLMIPLTFLMVGIRWQLAAVVLVMVVLLWLAWKYMHLVKLPVTWPFVMGYASAMVLVSEAIYVGSKMIDYRVPIHLEVLLPAFVMGCLLARPAGHDPHSHNSVAWREQGPESPQEQRVATLVAACFMVLVGLSMPPIQLSADAPASKAATTLSYDGVPPEVLADKHSFPGWGMIAAHVLLITLISNLGKMFPALCYRRDASLRERLAVSVCMFPRGEVGAGVLVVSLSYGLSGPAITVAVLSLVLNLICSGLFIVIVKRLLVKVELHPSSPKNYRQATADHDGDLQHAALSGNMRPGSAVPQSRHRNDPQHLSGRA